MVRGDSAGNPPRVRISIKGSAVARRGLLEIIRNEFDKIHATIPGLGVQETVPVPKYNVEPLNYDELLAYEADGLKTRSIFVDGKLVALNVIELLDGIAPKTKRQARANRKKKASRGVTVNAGDHNTIYYNLGDGAMNTDRHDINIGRDNYGQVGQILENCTNTVNAMPSGERKDLLAELVAQVEQLVKALPADNKDDVPYVAKNLEMAVKEVTSKKPDRDWYSLSAKGLLEAAKWTKDFSGDIAGTLLNLGKSVWSDFLLPK